MKKTINSKRHPSKNRESHQDPRFTVGIEDSVLKRLLRGGDRGGFALPHDPQFGLVILIRGKPGTGKSTLALQILDMLDSATAKKYYSMEQSRDDLLFKLISMRIAKAVFQARQPAYKGNKVLADEFICDLEAFKGQLARFLAPEALASLESEITEQLEHVRVPLYGDPKPAKADGSAEATNRLVQEVYRLVKVSPSHVRRNARIHFDDGRETNEDGRGGSEESLKGFRSRVLLASAALNKLFESEENQERDERPFVVLDGLSLLSTSERELIELQNIVERLRRHSQIGILVYEPNSNESISLDHHADMVIELDRADVNRPNAYLIHTLSFKKARYQEAALGQHQFKIRSSGVALFPSLHFQVQHYNYMDLELKRSLDPCWTPSLRQKKRGYIGSNQSASVLDMIFAPRDGESIVLLGSRGSFKTELCMDFLSRGNWGCTHNEARIEPGLLMSLIDNAPDIQRGLACPWRAYLKRPCPLTFCEQKCGRDKGLLKQVRPFCQRPGCITPSEFLHYVIERLKGPEDTGKKLKRICFWDMTQMDYRFPLFEEDRMLLPAMMDIFKSKGLKSLFMGAGNADNTPAASAVADNVLFCWRSKFLTSGAKQVYENQSQGSLLLYVDRTSASSRQSGKLLYSLPILQDNKLLIPKNRAELNDKKGLFQMTIEDLESEDTQNTTASSEKPNRFDDDLEQIKRITNMQGVQ